MSDKIRFGTRVTPDEKLMLEGILEQCRAQDINPNDVKHGWIKGEKSSLFFTNPEYKKQDERNFKQELTDLISQYEPDLSLFNVTYHAGEHCLVLDPADVHIGKLASSFETGEDYNSQIAVQRVKEGISGILEKVAGFGIEKIVFIGGNDILHIDTPKRTTTSGTPQDTDGMWYDNFLIAFRLYADVITALQTIAPVHFIYNPSNHDYTNGFMLCQAIAAYFRNVNTVTFDVSIAHRKYYSYGNNLIGSTHGDGAKTGDLALLMAHEAADDWAGCKHRYFYIHHFHHKVGKDIMSVCIESLRTPSGTDSWHHRQGYQHAPKAVEGYIHHKQHGQVARITHLF